MTFPDRRLERPLEPPEAGAENRQDVIPPTERNQDLDHTTHDLVNETARPLTEEERKAADRDTPVGERVYAPASERVPRTVSDYGSVVEHTDTHTPERQAMGESEPAFTRVARPSTAPTPYNDPPGMDSTPQPQRWTSNMSTGTLLPIGMGWIAMCVGGGIGVWLWMRWRRERNKPINRLRRQARQTADQARQRAYELRDRMPDMPEFPDEATRPAVGLGTALVSLAILLWQQSQSRSRTEEMRARTRDMGRRADKASRQATRLGRRATETVSDIDWQQRLMQLRERWTPGRVELEKISIPRRSF